MFFRCLLLVLVCLQDFTVAENANGPDKCCFSFQTHKIPERVITEYQETDAQCTKAGVIFTLKSGRHVCADPRVEWVQITMIGFERSIISDANGPQCCSSFRTHPIPVRVIETYKETHMDCTKAGIICTVKSGHRVCTDPGVEWVQQALKRFDQRLFASSIISDKNGPQCCSSFRTHPIPVSVIETYKETQMNCPKARVIFTLKYGHLVCTDPGVEWVQQAMKRFDRRLFASSIISDANGPQCCSSFRTHPIPVSVIETYEETQMNCPKAGVIFTLKYGHHVCTDPGVEWVQQALKRFDQRLFASSIISDANGPQCCSSFRTHPIPVSVIETYEETQLNCSKAGVIFTLKYGHHVCTDPGVEWVQQALKRFDQRLFASSIISDANGPEHCCFRFQTQRIPVRVITGYKVTQMNCTKAGVIFTLKNDRLMCTDPRVEWVRQAMKRIDQRLSTVRDQNGPSQFSFQKIRNPIRIIEAYKETRMDCAIAGIIFTLMNCRCACPDPWDEWVQQAMKRIYQDQNGPSQFSFQKIRNPIRIIEAYKETRMDCAIAGIIPLGRVGATGLEKI
ncbi:uncharacterized protein LOC128318220 isoform X2 [Pangasianodon hypophthalmus]|uniref:uncharacterized protein LOC128318220 isoform X2 n=1 Tax=Pangasianodon hypophthalmus TaxID=310915 RepID=UPI0023082B3A|nr:uncharacterized protein LOC128318220 isoform X2 [Pangasianodon hypophthalmus]